MAQCVAKVYLGYEDEAVTEKTQPLHFTVNKIGGYPNWPPLSEKVNFPTNCQKCGLNRLLITQCYAPLEKSQYHRTLYIFACINAQCWELSDSWTCVRSQIKDDSSPKTEAVPSAPKVYLNWCSGADEWDENVDGDIAEGNNIVLENSDASSKWSGSRLSDNKEGSKLLEMETIEHSLGKMQFCDPTNAENMISQENPILFSAVGVPEAVAAGSLGASAELETENQEEVVNVDPPCAPSVDIQQLMLEKVELPCEIHDQLTNSQLQFVAKFMSVEEEFIEAENVGDSRVDELLHKYRRENGEVPDLKSPQGPAGISTDEEVYEEAIPLHGDRMFHTFVSRLRANPGQILRYSRTASPLLGAPVPSSCMPSACPRCKSPYICELQLMPAFASTLHLAPNVGQISHLHFLSVLVFTCKQSCWNEHDSYVEEPVVFQPEMF